MSDMSTERYKVFKLHRIFSSMLGNKLLIIIPRRRNSGGNTEDEEVNPLEIIRLQYFTCKSLKRIL